MSLGFSIGDFMALSKLTMSLEVSRRLYSVYILIDELRDQLEEQGSLVNRLGAVPRKKLGLFVAI